VVNIVKNRTNILIGPSVSTDTVSVIVLADLRLVRNTYGFDVFAFAMYESSLDNRNTMLWSFHRLRIETSFSIQNHTHIEAS
jgi:hypothetical protein